MTMDAATPRNECLRQRIAILESNEGRNSGWFVLSPSNEPIATLTDCCCWVEMFWDSFLVTPLDGHDETLTHAFWYPACHQLRNIEFPNYETEVFGHFEPESNRVTLRFAYIPVNFNWLDRLRAPHWFLRQFLRTGNLY